MEREKKIDPLVHKYDGPSYILIMTDFVFLDLLHSSPLSAAQPDHKRCSGCTDKRGFVVIVFFNYTTIDRTKMDPRVREDDIRM